MLFTFAIHTYLNAAVLDWWGGHAFGQRRLLSCLPLFALGLAHIADAVLRRGVAWGRWLLAPLYVGLSLGLTFPFNILLGIPLYSAIAQRVIGA